MFPLLEMYIQPVAVNISMGIDRIILSLGKKSVNTSVNIGAKQVAPGAKANARAGRNAFTRATGIGYKRVKDTMKNLGLKYYVNITGKNSSPAHISRPCRAGNTASPFRRGYPGV